MHTQIIGHLAGSSRSLSSVQQPATIENQNNNHQDNVFISNSGTLLARLDDFMDGAGKDGAITLDEIAAFCEKSLERAEQEIRNTFNKLNINVEEKLKFDVDPYGSLEVSGSTDSINEALTSALQNNEVFMQSYAAAGASGCLLAAAEAAVPFQREYASDAKSAVDKYNWLFNKEWNFTMFFEKDNVSHKVS